jgi:multiple sugar transport system substrate-binding protein
LGCSSPKPSAPQAKTPAKPGISVSCSQGQATEILKRFAPSFQAATDIAVQIKSRSIGEPAAPEADLWVIEPAEMPQWAASDKLQPVPDEMRASGGEYSWKSLLPAYRSKLLVWDKEVFAVPLADEPIFCFWRTDLLSDVKNRAAFKAKFGRDLTPPATWQDVERIAQFFQGQPRPGLARPCASLTALPKDDDGLDRAFYLIAAPFVRQAIREDHVADTSPRLLFSFHYDVETGKPLLHTAGFRAALEMLCRLQSYRAAEGADPLQSFADGEAVLCFAGAPSIVRFQHSPIIKNRFTVSRVPGSDLVYGLDNAAPTPATANDVPYLGAAGAVMVVPKSSAHAAEAFKLAAYLSNPKTSRDIATDPVWGGGVFRHEHLAGGMGWGSFDLGLGQTEELVKILRETYVHTEISNPLLRLRIPDQASHRSVVLREIRAALFAGKKPADAMRDADAAWRDLDSKMTPAERLSTYRLSVNLFGGG